MKKIIEYKIIYAESSIIFDTKINKLIADDWQPYGNPYGTPEVNTVFLQAMVKYEEKKEPNSGMRDNK